MSATGTNTHFLILSHLSVLSHCPRWLCALWAVFFFSTALCLIHSSLLFSTRREAGAFVRGRERQGPSFYFCVSWRQDSQLSSRSPCPTGVHSACTPCHAPRVDKESCFLQKTMQLLLACQTVTSWLSFPVCVHAHTHTHTLQSGLHSNTSPSSEVPRPSAGGQAWRSAMKGGWMADGVQSAPACQGRTAPADPPGAGRQCRTCFSEALFSWLMNSWTTAR